MAKYKLGPKAGFFYDPTTQKKVLPGKSVNFNSEELLSRRTKTAIVSGHLILDSKKEDVDAPTHDELLNKFKEAYEKGEKASILKEFKADALKDLAVYQGFEVDPKDTKDQLAEVLIEDIYGESDPE